MKWCSAWLVVLSAVVAGRAEPPVNTTFYKCCPKGEKPAPGKTCVPRDTPESLVLPPLYIDEGEPSEKDPSEIEIGIRRPDCESLFPLTEEDGVYYLLQNGSLLVPKYKTEFNSSVFCLEYLDGGLKPVACLSLLSAPSDYEPVDDAVTTVYPIGLVISLPFLLVTFLAYASVTELRNLHGRTLLSHVLSLFVGYTSLATVQLATSQLSKFYCIFLAYTIQYFFLAVFFWLNVMCFDIYWAFSGMKKLTGSAKEREHKKFLLYSLYAWGGALIILVITIIMDFTDALPKNSPYKPDMGEMKCFFHTNEGTWLYFYGPMAVLIFSNLLMFAITARRIYVLARETSVLKSKDSRRHDKNDKERFHLYWKLFIVMGINWVMELVSWILRGPQQIWYVTDITNTLQGVFIFIIFVCKRRIVRLLNQKLCPGMKLLPARSTKSSGGTVSSASGTASTSTNGAQTVVRMDPSTEERVRFKNAYDSDSQI